MLIPHNAKQEAPQTQPLGQPPTLSLNVRLQPTPPQSRASFASMESPINAPLLLDRAWEDVQKRTFTKWINSHLKGEGIMNLNQDFCNGVKLIELVETLTQRPVGKFNQSPRFRIHKIDNVNKALQAIRQDGVSLTNIGAEDIVDGIPKLLLGLAWRLVSRYSISSISGEKAGLMDWCQDICGSSMDIKDFSASWKDGVAFCALVNNQQPNLIDMDRLHPLDERKNCELAFSAAEEHLGIPRLLEVSDIVDYEQPDERSVMTYVAQFFHAQQTPAEAKKQDSTSKESQITINTTTLQPCEAPDSAIAKSAEATVRKEIDPDLPGESSPGLDESNYNSASGPDNLPSSRLPRVQRSSTAPFNTSGATDDSPGRRTPDAASVGILTKSRNETTPSSALWCRSRTSSAGARTFPQRTVDDAGDGDPSQALRLALSKLRPTSDSGGLETTALPERSEPRRRNHSSPSAAALRKTYRPDKRHDTSLESCEAISVGRNLRKTRPGESSPSSKHSVLLDDSCEASAVSRSLRKADARDSPSRSPSASKDLQGLSGVASRLRRVGSTRSGHESPLDDAENDLEEQISVLERIKLWQHTLERPQAAQQGDPSTRFKFEDMAAVAESEDVHDGTGKQRSARDSTGLPVVDEQNIPQVVAESSSAKFDHVKVQDRLVFAPQVADGSIQTESRDVESEGKGTELRENLKTEDAIREDLRKHESSGFAAKANAGDLDLATNQAVSDQNDPGKCPTRSQPAALVDVPLPYNNLVRHEIESTESSAEADVPDIASFSSRSCKAALRDQSSNLTTGEVPEAKRNGLEDKQLPVDGGGAAKDEIESSVGSREEVCPRPQSCPPSALPGQHSAKDIDDSNPEARSEVKEVGERGLTKEPARTQVAKTYEAGFVESGQYQDAVVEAESPAVTNTEDSLERPSGRTVASPGAGSIVEDDDNNTPSGFHPFEASLSESCDEGPRSNGTDASASDMRTSGNGGRLTSTDADLQQEEAAAFNSRQSPHSAFMSQQCLQSLQMSDGKAASEEDEALDAMEQGLSTSNSSISSGTRRTTGLETVEGERREVPCSSDGNDPNQVGSDDGLFQDNPYQEPALAERFIGDSIPRRNWLPGPSQDRGIDLDSRCSEIRPGPPSSSADFPVSDTVIEVPPTPIERTPSTESESLRARASDRDSVVVTIGDTPHSALKAFSTESLASTLQLPSNGEPGENDQRRNPLQPPSLSPDDTEVITTTGYGIQAPGLHASGQVDAVRAVNASLDGSPEGQDEPRQSSESLERDTSDPMHTSKLLSDGGAAPSNAPLSSSSLSASSSSQNNRTVSSPMHESPTGSIEQEGDEWGLLGSEHAIMIETSMADQAAAVPAAHSPKSLESLASSSPVSFPLHKGSQQESDEWQLPRASGSDGILGDLSDDAKGSDTSLHRRPSLTPRPILKFALPTSPRTADRNVRIHMPPDVRNFERVDSTPDFGPNVPLLARNAEANQGDDENWWERHLYGLIGAGLIILGSVVGFLAYGRNNQQLKIVVHAGVPPV